MQLNATGLQDKKFWAGHKIALPFDRQAVIAKTTAAPRWLHFDPAIFSGPLSPCCSKKLLDTGAVDYGIITAAPNSREIIDAVHAPHANLSLVVTMQVDGSMEKKVVGSVTEAVACVPGSQD